MNKLKIIFSIACATLVFTGLLADHQGGYRTQGLPTPNKVPHPTVHSFQQRSGTNLIDFDIEIVDPDDATATFGILGAIDGRFQNLDQLVQMTTFIEGTGAKIGKPVATNTTHRITWDAGADLSSNKGSLQFNVYCQDARRTNPLDLHLLGISSDNEILNINKSLIDYKYCYEYMCYLISINSDEVSLGKKKHVYSRGYGDEISLGEFWSISDGNNRSLYVNDPGHPDFLYYENSYSSDLEPLEKVIYSRQNYNGITNEGISFICEKLDVRQASEKEIESSIYVIKQYGFDENWLSSMGYGYIEPYVFPVYSNGFFVIK